jgi:tetratricopeptide (TPR) repeat protein
LPRLLPGIFAVCDRGRVRVTQKAAQRFVWFADGRVLAITSAADDERLGTWLVARGLLDKRSLHEALTFRSPSERLGAALQRHGMLAGETVSQELEVLTFTLAGKLLFENGTFDTDLTTVLPDDAAIVDYSPEPLFVLAARRAHDTDQLERVAGGVRRWVAVPGAASWEGDVDLQGLERQLMSSLGQPRSLAELQSDLAESGRHVARALVCLAVLGLVRELTGAPLADVAQTPYPAANPRLKALLSGIEPHPQRTLAARLRAGDALDADTAEDAKQQALAMLRAGGDRRQAQKLLAAALDVVPDASCLTVLAELEMHNPLWRARALERLKQAVVLAPQHTAAWLALANYWSLRLQPDKQRRCLEKILAYEPNHREARSALGLLESAEPGFSPGSARS